MKSPIRLLAQSATVAALLVSAFATMAHGQQPGGIIAGQAERDRRARDELIREQLDQEREMMMMMTEKLRDSAQPVRREPRLAIMQIREDYVRMQVVNNELAQAVAA